MESLKKRCRRSLAFPGNAKAYEDGEDLDNQLEQDSSHFYFFAMANSNGLSNALFTK